MKTESFDTLIIGAGLSGLFCGYTLAKEGQKVCILEKNPIAGGCIQNFSFRKKVFDPGAHYLGGLEQGQSMHLYFKYFDLINKLPLAKLDENAFDKLHFTDNVHAFAQGKENFAKVLAADFPSEEKNLKAFVDYLVQFAHKFPGFNLLYEPKHIDTEIFSKNAFEEIQKFITNPKLQNILFGNSLAYNGKPPVTPFYVYALLTCGYIESAYRIIGGSGKIAEQIADNFENAGGVIHYDYKVNQIVKNAMGFEVKSIGQKPLSGKNLISTIHPAELVDFDFNSMLRNSYKSRLKKMKNTTGVFSVYAVLKKNSFPFINSVNYCFEADSGAAYKQFDAQQFGNSFLLLTQPSQSEQKFADSMQIMTPDKFDVYEKWADTTVGRRGKDYREFKKQTAFKLIHKADKFFPGIADSVEHINTSTPLTYRDYTASSKGSIYGTEKDSRNYLLTSLSHKTKTAGLYIGGQSTNIHGVHGTAAGAYMICSEILGKDYLRNKILK